MASRSLFRTWEDYFIPGTTVLKNKFTTADQPFGETDPGKLSVLEESHALSRLRELRANPIDGRFDYDHMKAIHRHVFQDVYEWAGEERTAPVGHFMTKNGHSYYPAGASLTAAAEAEYQKLARANLLRGLEQDQFTTALAESWGEINVVHSFREGNTRTQFVFFERLCAQAGYELDIERFAKDRDFRDRFIAARFHSQDTGRNDQLAEVLGEVVGVREQRASQRDSMFALLDSAAKNASVVGPTTSQGHSSTAEIYKRHPELDPKSRQDREEGQAPLEGPER